MRILIYYLEFIEVLFVNFAENLSFGFFLNTDDFFEKIDKLYRQVD